MNPCADVQLPEGSKIDLNNYNVAEKLGQYVQQAHYPIERADFVVHETRLTPDAVEAVNEVVSDGYRFRVAVELPAGFYAHLEDLSVTPRPAWPERHPSPTDKAILDAIWAHAFAEGPPHRRLYLNVADFTFLHVWGSRCYDPETQREGLMRGFYGTLNYLPSETDQVTPETRTCAVHVTRKVAPGMIRVQDANEEAIHRKDDVPGQIPLIAG